MAERDRYIPGVPCWVDVVQPDVKAGVDFYGGLFGWEFENVLPPDSPVEYFIGRIRGRDVAAVGSVPGGAPPVAKWNTYVWVDSADETASKVRAAGGDVLAEPFDIMDAGRRGVFADPAGAEFSVWEPKQNRGAGIVNEHGALNFNDLHTRDAAGAKAFYGEVFGWETLTLDGGFTAWTLPGYVDHLEQNDPGIRERMAEGGAPEGFADVVASLVPAGGDESDHWGVTFAVDDAEAIAARAAELGGKVLVPPFAAPWVKMTVLADPNGATFIASQFMPENKDVPAAGPDAANQAA